MIIRIYNNDGSDYADYEGTLEEIREECKSRIALDSWKNGHSEVLEDNKWIYQFIGLRRLIVMSI